MIGASSHVNARAERRWRRCNSAAGQAQLPLVVFPWNAELTLSQAGPNLRACAERYLSRLGRILFRGFNVGDTNALREFVSAFAQPTHAYQFGSLSSSGGLGTQGSLSTRARNQGFHPQRSYGPGAASRLWLCCTRAGSAGSGVPIADTRGVYDLVPPPVRRRWLERGVEYVCQIREDSAAWSQFFPTQDATSVERHCRALGIGYEWLGNRVLRLSKPSELVATHWQTHERLWLTDTDAFEPEALVAYSRALGGAGWRARHADGSEIAPADIQAVRAAFEASAVEIPWEAGDVLVVDNLLTAHGSAGAGSDLQLELASEYAAEPPFSAV